MSAIAFGVPVQFDKAYVEGITKLSSVDIEYAEQLGYRIKLLGIARRTTRASSCACTRRWCPSAWIANVEGAMNAVVVRDAVGTTLTTARARAAADRQRRDRRPGGRDAPAHRGCRAPRATRRSSRTR